jgi:predicted metalloprotease with PDZ domain
VLDFLRYLDANYVKQGRGFAEEELDDILRTVGGAPAAEFFERYIDGDEIPDPTEFLDVLGYRCGPDDGLEEREPVSPAQLRARSDYLSISGEP